MTMNQEQDQTRDMDDSLALRGELLAAAQDLDDDEEEPATVEGRRATSSARARFSESKIASWASVTHNGSGLAPTISLVIWPMPSGPAI